MKTAEQWVKQFEEENRVPMSVIEEASHNNISEKQVRAIQEDAYYQALSDAQKVIGQLPYVH